MRPNEKFKKTKANKIKVKLVKHDAITITKAVNGYIAVPDGRPYAQTPEHVFETDAALFKFLRKHFCEGYK